MSRVRCNEANFRISDMLFIARQLLGKREEPCISYHVEMFSQTSRLCTELREEPFPPGSASFKERKEMDPSFYTSTNLVRSAKASWRELLRDLYVKRCLWHRACLHSCSKIEGMEEKKEERHLPSSFASSTLADSCADLSFIWDSH